MKKEIKNIILNKDFDLVEKIINVYKLVSTDYKALSKELGIPEIVIKTSSGTKKTSIKKTGIKPQTDLQYYIDEFYQLHKRIHGRKFDFDGKEVKHIKYCMKKFSERKQWAHVLILIEKSNDLILKNKTVHSSWKFIISNLKPSIIYSSRNFILNEETRIGKILNNKAKLKKEWSW